MDVQHQIRHHLARPESVDHITGVLDSGDIAHRTALAERLCADFGFRDGRGRPQVSTCLSALRALERAGQVQLPARRTPGGSCVRRRRSSPVAPARDVPAQVGHVQGLALVVVSDPVQREIWQGLMEHEHPQGAGPLVGRQMRYLLWSEHGWLGAIGVAASALQLAARDRWIGWDAATRLDHLHRVVGLSRFLIRPQVHCRNLASHVLGQLLRRLGADFCARYGFAPWLIETFVSPPFDGASLRASNWQLLGETAGRGRQDCRHDVAAGRKALYIHELAGDWRTRLGVGPPPADTITPEATDGLDGLSWAEAEFSAAAFNDARLTARLVTIAQLKGARPMASFPQAASGNRAGIKGYYRFIDQPEKTAVTPSAILAPHRARTLERMRTEPVVLCIQDGTDLNFASRPGCEGLGVIGTNQTGATVRGLHLHSTLAVTPSGLPLGVVGARFDAPSAKGEAKAPEESKTERWLEGYRNCAALGRDLPDGRMVCVMDREADAFAVFETQQAHPHADILVRAKTRRKVAAVDASGTTGPAKLVLKIMQAAPVLGTMIVAVDRLTPRPKRSKRPKKAGRTARSATLVVRSQTVELAPTSREHQGKPPIRLQAVMVEEERAPADASPIRWLLFTTLPANTLEDCRTVVGYYAQRWRIEDWHRILKSGCKVEELENRSADRLARAVAINLVIAWRIHLMTLLGRDHPELSPDILFSKLEIKALKAFAARQRYAPPDTLAGAVLTMARIGGHIHRTRGPPPGTKVIWRGYATLVEWCIGHELMMGLEEQT
ncbi:MAG: IS4 family transposase [Gemmatimonadota bacterium]|nr:IS4 family transposase [Gemmatimonadota bacterium]